MTTQQKYDSFRLLYAKHLAYFLAGDLLGYVTTQQELVGFDWGNE